MANLDIGDLTALTGANAVAGDQVHVFDVSELDATPKDKSMTLGELEKFFEHTMTVAASDETTALTVADDKINFAFPFAATLTKPPRAFVTTAPTGSGITVDITEGGTTIFSTLLTIDATEKTSVTAATAAVLSDSAIADDAIIGINVDAVGSTIAGAGLKITFYYTRA